MITQQEYDELVQLHQQAGVIEAKIEKHILEILNMVAEVHGGKLSWWVFPGDEIHGEIASGSLTLGGNSIDVYWECESPLEDDEPYYQDHYLGSKIPTDWLFMSVSDIKQLLLDDIERIKKEEEELAAKEKAKKEARAAQKAALKESAAEKLTKDERKALGI